MPERDLSLAESGALEKLGEVFGTHALLYPTATGLRKRIFDATQSIRSLLSEATVHDYESQPFGPQNKVVQSCFYFDGVSLVDTPLSLYRSLTRGDTRFWIRAADTALPGDVVSLMADQGLVVAVNLTAVERLDPGYVALDAWLLPSALAPPTALGAALAEASSRAE